MTQQHPSLDAAKAAVTRLATEAMKLGWQQRTRSGGFTAKPDVFTALPKPNAVPAPASTPAKTTRKK